MAVTVDLADRRTTAGDTDPATERRSPRKPLIPHGLLAAGLALCVFYPATLSGLHRIIIPFFILFYLAWAQLSVEYHGARRVSRLRFVAVGLYLPLVVVIGRLIAAGPGADAAITFQRVFALYPLAALTGWLAVRTGRIKQYYSWLLAVGLLTLPLAYFEYLANTSLLNSHSYARNGHARAVVGADHPLVLATLFLGLMPIAFFVLRRFPRTACVLLFLGVVSTGSNGPIGVAALVLLICLFPSLPRVLFGSAKPILTLLMALVAFLGIGSAFLWSDQIAGNSTTAVSNEYRAALYWLLPRMVAAHPFGFGLSGFGSNVYFFSTVRGVVDVKQSTDSELVYSAAQFGIFALAFFAAVCFIGARAVPKNEALGASTLAVSLAGFFLALHSWESMGSFWLFGVGACFAIARSSGVADQWHGLSRHRQLIPDEYSPMFEVETTQPA